MSSFHTAMTEVLFDIVISFVPCVTVLLDINYLSVVAEIIIRLSALLNCLYLICQREAVMFPSFKHFITDRFVQYYYVTFIIFCIKTLMNYTYRI